MSVEVGRFHDLHEAELAAGLLRSAGLRAQVVDHFLIGMDPLMQRAVGGLRVTVPPDQAEDARAILARVQAGDFATDEPDDLPPAGADVGQGLFVLISALILPAMAAGALGAQRAVSTRRRVAALAIAILLVLLVIPPLILIVMA